MLSTFRDVISRLEHQKITIEKAIAALREFDDGNISESAAPKNTSTRKAKRKRIMSEAGRKRIADAQRRRWATVREAAKKAAA